MKIKLAILFNLIASLSFAQRWTEQQANDWQKKIEWPVGANYAPAYAINQLEMWQAETFDLKAIDKEFAWAENIGMNTMRVFLHDLLYQQDPVGFLKRMDDFLVVADKHHIKILFVFFDSVWNPYPELGKQRDPMPHVHNSGWVQSPGRKALEDPTQYARLEVYVKAVTKRFANDARILGWDVWNEPDNMTGTSYERIESPRKVELVAALLPKVFAWVRSQKPTQPLTSGVWVLEFNGDKELKPMEKIQLENSDVISFHNYSDEKNFEQEVAYLKKYNRPILCTEYMARGNNSTFQGVLPVAKKYNVAAYNWGFVSGKSQTIYPWDSWEKKYVSEPPLWFHDIFRGDGTPYHPYEVEFIKNITSTTLGK
jgi:Cellulase (glycosyl hydrolase family 5)